MRFLYFIFAFSLLLCPSVIFAKADSYSVAHETVYLPIEYDKSYIELSIYYPTSSTPSMQKISREGERLLLAHKGKPLDIEHNLLLISPSSFADRFQYSSLAHAFAKRGNVVVVLSHTGDSLTNMLYTMTAIQFPIRAEHIKASLDYVLSSAYFNINYQTITSISFAETAFAPLLLYNFGLSNTHYTTYCEHSPHDTLCNPPISLTLKRLLADIDYYAVYKKDEKEKYLKELAYWQAEKEKTRAIEAQTLSEEELVGTGGEVVLENDIFPAPAKFDLSYPYIKNFIFVDPSFSFLIDKAKDIYIFNSVSLYSSSNADHNTEKDWQNTYLEEILPQYETDLLEVDLLSDLINRCPENNMHDITRICSKLSPKMHTKVIEAFVDKVELHRQTQIKGEN